MTYGTYGYTQLLAYLNCRSLLDGARRVAAAWLDHAWLSGGGVFAAQHNALNGAYLLRDELMVRWRVRLPLQVRVNPTWLHVFGLRWFRRAAVQSPVYHLKIGIEIIGKIIILNTKSAYLCYIQERNFDSINILQVSGGEFNLKLSSCVFVSL